MEGFGKGKRIVLACFIAAYIVTFVCVGMLDNAFDAVLSADDIARHDAEWALSASFEAFVIVGFFSLWVLDVGSWHSGFVAGLLAALAAGGFHVMLHVLPWLPMSLVMGFAAGVALFAIGGKRPGACMLLGSEAALAVFQIVFFTQNM